MAVERGFSRFSFAFRKEGGSEERIAELHNNCRLRIEAANYQLGVGTAISPLESTDPAG